MEILIAETAGFCFGVKRAVDMAFEAAKSHAGKTATLGPIIHNPQVVQQLADKGVVSIEKIEDNHKFDLLLI